MASKADAFCGRHYVALALAVLSLAAFNLSFRLTRENVAEWDESLYAVSAIEMTQSGDWVGTTFQGQLDYSNSKPPLNVWLLALAFEWFGPGLASLRAPSAAVAWATVLALVLWTRRHFGATTSLLSGLVLSTAFGFLHVHSGRSANPDALMALLLLLLVIVEAESDVRSARLAWLGPLMAGVFLLKGMAVLLPLTFVIAMEAWRLRRGRPAPWRSLATAAVLFVVPVAAWATARWRVDEWRFLRLLVTQDLLQLGTTAMDGLGGPPWYYLDVIQRHHYDWLVAGIVGLAWLPPGGFARIGRHAWFWRHDRVSMALGSWTLVSLAVPSLLQTKLQWYVNPFYPALALGVGWVLARSLWPARPVPRRSRLVLATVVVLAVGTAEGKFVWHSVYQRPLEGSAQELLIGAREQLRGRTVFRSSWTRAERFVVRGIVGGELAEAPSVERFLAESPRGSYLLAEASLRHDGLVVHRANGRFGLFGRAN